MASSLSQEIKDIHSIPAQVVDQVLAALQSLRFGSVEIIVHDSQVVQIERKEKFRFSHESK